ncbi:hypothetical protein ABB37_08144 [Leptomonas pyrrhocoris]|uniref:Uncharacterized protein n=1 Tax=Leptomonas pyrrhocoris TaxID=157538 RepID=A0A0N0VDM7_LEPPY|nr:hypothetical protein ABB37_08144 [Leptomonas pyrrhocoris]KPA75994.1 hypothetical protein ABB37_08144 [Leptomonas pyrrhocoris]|eukprot:XP_015654433.1 hypothetical protein ABB37_08144 [Leptomonas pyrrhocoris]
MENRVVALAVLENLIHWPLPHRSGYVAPSSVSDDGGEEDTFNANAISAGDVDDLLREPRQRKLDRYRAVLLLPLLCHKLGSRWVESEVVPYLLRCLEEEDAQLSLVTGLALLGVTLPRRGPLGPSATAATASPTSTMVKTTRTAASTPAPAGVTTPPPTTAGGGSGHSSPTTPTATVSSSNAYLSLNDVQPVCALLAASSTEETRAFAAQVVLPHLYFGTSLERDITLESWDLKFVPLSVLHADMIASNSGEAGEDDGSPAAAAAAARAEAGDDGTATLRFVAAVRQQLARQRQQDDVRKGQWQQRSKNTSSATTSNSNTGESGASSSNDVGSNSASFPKLKVEDVAATSAGGSLRLLPAIPTDEEVRRRCQALAAEDESMQFLFNGTYDTLTGPWGFSGCRLAVLGHGATPLHPSSDNRRNSTNGGGSSSRERGAATLISAGGGFRSFRPHERRVSGSQSLRGAPPRSQRPLSEADWELYGACYAADTGNNGANSNGSGIADPGDDFFSVNVRARALVGDLTRWMEALTPPEQEEADASPATPTTPSSQLFFSGQTILSLYDYVAHDARREVLRSRWRALLRLLQSLLESPYPGPVAVAVELISALLHALQFVAAEVASYLQRGLNDKGPAPFVNAEATAVSTTTTSEASFFEKGDADSLLWGIAVPASPLLTTAQLQSFLYRTTRRHIAYCVAAALTVRKISVPPSLQSNSVRASNSAAGAASWRAPTEALARLLRATLPVAQNTLTELLLRHHLIMKLSAPPEASLSAREARSSSGACEVLQMGPGPCESRAAALRAWDLSFSPSSAHAGPCAMPDDASFLLSTAAAAGDASSSTPTRTESAVLDRSLWLPGTLNSFSIFRLHRVIRRAVLLALPLCVDLLSLFSPTASPRTAAGAATTPTVFSLRAVCPMLLQVLVPPGALPALLRVLHAAATLPDEAAPRPQHVDPSMDSAPALAAAFPLLWSAMTAPQSVFGAAAAEQAQETPASVDFELLEAALDSVQRLVAEVAVQLSSTSTAFSVSAAAAVAALPVAAMHSVCAQLFTLVAACVRWVPRYTHWKARWLMAQKLPRLTSTFCFVLTSVADLVKEKVADATGRDDGSAATSFQEVAVVWMHCALQLLASVWSCAETFGAAPLNDLTDDEEMEVRCVAVRSAAFTFRRVVEAVLRISANRHLSSSADAASASVLLVLLPSLKTPLTQLLDATAQCALVGANDADPRVRCGAAEALAVLSRTLSMLVAAADERGAALVVPRCTTDDGRSSEEALWTRYLRTNTEALLRLMSDEKPTVQLALVSQLTDLLLLRMRQQQQPSHGTTAANGGTTNTNSLTGSCGGVDGHGGNDSDNGELQRSTDQVQHEALLQCLRQLAHHELWRLREQYAVLLAHLCERLLQAAMTIQPRKVWGRRLSVDDTAAAVSTTGRAAGRDAITAASTNGDGSASAEAETSPYGHTHPLYQLARTELLTLLVAVLFDKVKAVRDAALDAVEGMCLQLAAATRQSNTFLQQDARSSPSGLASHVNGGAAGMGRNLGSAIGATASPTAAAATFQNRGSSSGNNNSGGGAYDLNTFVDNVLWPRINAYAKAWETYLSRSALLHIALRLRVEKTSVFIPLLDQLARDPVLNVRLVVAKIILEVLLRSGSSGAPDVYARTTTSVPGRDGEAAEDGSGGAAGTDEAATAASLTPELPSGTVAYRILMNKTALSGSGVGAVLPPLQFTEEERTGVILQILRQLLKDASSDVRDEAAKALKVCF